MLRCLRIFFLLVTLELYAASKIFSKCLGVLSPISSLLFLFLFFAIALHGWQCSRLACLAGDRLFAHGRRGAVDFWGIETKMR